MKIWSLTHYITAVFIAISSLFFVNNTKAQVYGQVSLDLFYNELSPYGNWDMDPNYGDVWYPHEGTNFRPYSSNGYWAMTEYGNTWVSNYSWGWAPFHYGRWVYNSHRGWGWIPGYEWGPAWVEWRSGNGYFGWAPMMPHSGVSISINIPISAWCFAPVRYIYSPNFHRHAYYGRTNIYNRTTIIHNTYVVNNNHYYGGPSRRDIERSLGRKVEVRSIRQSDRPGATRVDKRSVSLYRPDRDANRSASRSVTPERRSSSKDVIRSGAGTNSRSTGNVQREMHIGNDGTTTIRNREARTESRGVTPNRTTTPTPQRDNSDRNGENVNRNIDRSTRTAQGNTVEKNASRERQNRGTAQQPQRMERTETPRVERTQPQRQERAHPQRQPNTQERNVRSSNTVHQASNSRSSQSSNVGRASSPKAERSTPPSNNRASSNTSRGGNGNGAERSRR